MTDSDLIADHYGNRDVLGMIEAGLARTGVSIERLTIDDLAPADELHVGGRLATEAFLGQLGYRADQHVLDVGCGMGGPARFAASRYGCRVTGIDLTAAFVTAGAALSRWVGLDTLVTLRQGSALAMPFDDAAFDAAHMMHVGMNIADKGALFAEVHRVLRAGAVFGVYDVMVVGPGALTFPVPWSTVPETSAVADPDAYRAALDGAGFEILATRERRDLAQVFVERARGAPAEAPPLGPRLSMGEDAPVKIANLVVALESGHLAPVEIIARKQ